MPAVAVSVEKATIGTLAPRATDAAAATDCAKSGPRISSAPSEIACARRGARAVRRAAVVLDQDLDAGGLEFAEREVGGVPEVLRDLAGIAGRRQRQEQRDPDRCRCRASRR